MSTTRNEKRAAIAAAVLPVIVSFDVHGHSIARRCMQAVLYADVLLQQLERPAVEIEEDIKNFVGIIKDDD
jgi:hypothetical protein